MIIPTTSDGYPKELHVGGDTYKIIFIKGLAHLGETDPEKMTIKLRAGMSKNETFRTFIHEALHAIEFSFPIKMKHKDIYDLEVAISELIFDNFI